MKSDLRRMRINAPSKHQSGHSLHGTNVLVDFSENLHSNAVTIYFLSGSTISQRVTRRLLCPGWKN